MLLNSFFDENGGISLNDNFDIKINFNIVTTDFLEETKPYFA